MNSPGPTLRRSSPLTAVAVLLVVLAALSIAPRSVYAASATATRVEGSTYYFRWYRNCRYVLLHSRWYPLGCNYRMSGRIFYYDRYRHAWYDYHYRVWWAQDRAGNWYIWTSRGWQLRQRRISSYDNSFAQQQLNTFGCIQLNALSLMSGGEAVNPWFHCG